MDILVFSQKLPVLLARGFPMKIDENIRSNATYFLGLVLPPCILREVVAA